MTLSIQGSDGFVASTAAWIATGRKTTKLTGWDFHPLKNHTFSRRTPRREGFAQRSAFGAERLFHGASEPSSVGCRAIKRKQTLRCAKPPRRG